MRRTTASTWSSGAGEFAVRGGIVDVFTPPTAEHPVRIDFFGDTVEEIRYFTVADQRSTDLTLPELTAVPCRELLLTDAVRERALELAEAHPELADMLERIAEGHAVEGMESLSSVLADGMELLVDVLDPPDTLVTVCDPELVRARAADLVTTGEEFLHASWAAAAGGGGKAPIDLGGASSFHQYADVRFHAMSRGLGWWSFAPPFAVAPDSAEVLAGEGDPMGGSPPWRPGRSPRTRSIPSAATPTRWSPTSGRQWPTAGGW